MSSSENNRPATRYPVSPDGDGRPAPIKAIRLRHPGRIVFAVILIGALALFVIDASQRPAYGWDNFAKYIFDKRISQAAFNTLMLTVYSMLIAIVLGITLAVMRLSENPVVKGVAWLYLWIFRGTPVYVQLVFWGLISTIYATIDIGIPFTAPWMVFQTKAVIDVFWLAVIGLSLNEAAYMAEIVRAGILSVDPGQDEAATALGMSWLQTMRRVIIPQAMRIIIPPIGNDTISMLKFTSLVSVLALPDLLYSAQMIYSRTYQTIPLLIVATIWYLVLSTILTLVEHYIEHRLKDGPPLELQLILKSLFRSKFWGFRRGEVMS